MHLDHFVVHIDGPERLKKIAEESSLAGFPFNPKKGKGDKGFKATNIWIGQEYFEITWLLKPDGGAWIPEWVDRYKKGSRGAVCIFLRTESLDELAKGFEQRGIGHRIERTSFKVLFGLYTVKLPWRILLLPPLPGTDVEISYIQYDPGTIDKFAKYWKPNSRENGINGIHSADIHVQDVPSTIEYLKKIFPDYKSNESGFSIPISEGVIRILATKTPQHKEHITLYAKSTNKEFDKKKFSIENVTVQTN